MIPMYMRLAALKRLPLLDLTLKAVPWPVYLVGGSVRDMFLGRRVRDLDLVVDGPLEEAAQKASAAVGVRAVPLGRSPKQIYRLNRWGLTLDLCHLEGPDIHSDLLRRDLTINALALDLKAPDTSWKIIDPCRGIMDLKERKARFVSEANVLADPIRLIRLFRLTANLDLTIQPDSLAMVKKHASLINRTAGERIREEMLLLLGAPRSCKTVTAMMKHDLLEALVPEITPLRGCGQGDYHHLNVLDHTLAALESLEGIICSPKKHFPAFAPEIRTYLDQDHCPALLKLSILLHDLGKPSTKSTDDEGRVHFFRHEIVGEECAARIAARFKLSGAETTLLRFIVRHHLQPFHLMEAHQARHLTPKGIFRLGRLTGGNLWGLLLHALADAEATQGPAQDRKGGPPAVRSFLNYLAMEIYSQRMELAKGPCLVTGRDLLVAFNLRPSPQIGRLLRAIEEAQATGRVRDRAAALALAAELLAQDSASS